MLRKSSVITTPRTSQPQSGWVTTASILSEADGPVVAGLLHDLGAELADGVVAAAHERAGPVGPLAFPAFLPVCQNFRACAR